MKTTFKFRLKNTNTSKLKKMAMDANFVWNYCNDVSMQYLDKRNKFLTWYDLQYLTSGCSRNLSITSQSINQICKEHATRRRQYRKRKLAWRSSKRSLGWIPFRGQCISVHANEVIYKKIKFRFWNSRKIEGKIKIGSFVQDSKGHWYICIVCDVPRPQNIIIDNRAVGIDLGLKTLATLSDGTIIHRTNLTAKYADKLAIAQRAGKKKHAKAIHAKIKNIRMDFNQKETTKLINNYGTIFVGNVSSSKLKKTRMAKSVSDAGWSSFKSMLAYKAIALGVEFKEVKENFSTVTCSGCFERSGPRGLSALGVREWTCKSCGIHHDRDVNAAKNILRFGRETPVKGNSITPVLKRTSTREPEI
jgi:putative transposase